MMHLMLLAIVSGQLKIWWTMLLEYYDCILRNALLLQAISESFNVESEPQYSYRSADGPANEIDWQFHSLRIVS